MMDGLNGFLTGKRLCALGLACLLAAGAVGARAGSASGLPSAPTPSATLMQGPYQVQQATPGPLSLGLDDAIARGVAENLQIKLARANELTVHGSILSVGNALLPNMQVVGQTQAQEIDLAAEGFKGQNLKAAGFTGTFNPIVKVNTDVAGADPEPAVVQCAGVLSVPRGAAGRARRGVDHVECRGRRGAGGWNVLSAGAGGCGAD